VPALQADVSLLSLIADLTKVFVGGILAAGITLWVSGRRQDQERHRAARHLAIRLIDIFERYAVESADAIQSNLNNCRDNPHDYTGIAYLPELSSLPEDEAGWRGLEPSHAMQAQTFGSQIQMGRSFVRAVGEHGDADDVEEEVIKQAVLLGESAWQLASALRAAYSLPAANPAYDILAVFSEEEDRLAKNTAARAEASAEFWAIQMAAEDEANQ
jgi:hypothetical protein